MVDMSRESCQTLLSLFHNCCVVDVWRVLHLTSVAFTWQSSDGLLSPRIDHIGVPYSWLHHVVSCKHLPCPFSDHCAVLLDTPIPKPIPRGPGRWKLNTFRFSDPGFVEEVASFWGLWKLQKPSFPTIQKWCDQGKKEISGLAVRYCQRKSTDKNMLRGILANLSLHLKNILTWAIPLSYLFMRVFNPVSPPLTCMMPRVLEYAHALNGRRKERPLPAISFAWKRNMELDLSHGK